ncbi:MAG: TlyA family RNA methyltransferase [Magnetococcales bacterium]|nr:TlyA family RNA methyltransferase [Magnetococcales bacterium]
MAVRQRLDRLLVARNLAQSVEEAHRLLMSGEVLVDDRPFSKPGALVAEGAVLRLRQAAHPWVSRGGVKLAHALESWQLSPQGLTCIDVGASTGGFTDVLLTLGAAKVFAVDVGYGQLAWKLVQDPRVVRLDRTNIREVSPEHLGTLCQMAVIDCSFISLRRVLPALHPLLRPDSPIIALVKPQFEALPEEVSSGGIVRDEAVHERVLTDLRDYLAQSAEWRFVGTLASPLPGAKGNREFLLLAFRC